MKKILVSLLLPFLFSPLSGQPAPAAKPDPLILTHVTVVDATGAPARPDMTVVITGNRITEIAEAKKVRLPKDA